METPLKTPLWHLILQLIGFSPCCCKILHLIIIIFYKIFVKYKLSYTDTSVIIETFKL